MTDSDRIAHLEARLDAMSHLVRNVLTALLVRGLLTRASVDHILKESAEALEDSHPGAHAELKGVGEQVPERLREAAGPGEDDDEYGGH